MFDEVFRAEGVEVVLTPPRAPRANAYPQGGCVRCGESAWTGSWSTTRGILLAVLAGFLAHYSQHRPHQGRGQRPPDRELLPPPVIDLAAVRVRRRKILHGLINEYAQAAAETEFPNSSRSRRR